MAKPDLSAERPGSAQAQPGQQAQTRHAAGAGGQAAKLKDMQTALDSTLRHSPVVLEEQAQRAGLDRIVQAGGQPTSVAQVGCELQRDWARQETAEGFAQILFGGDRPLAGARSEPAGNGARAGR